MASKTSKQIMQEEDNAAKKLTHLAEETLNRKGGLNTNQAQLSEDQPDDLSPSTAGRSATKNRPPRY
jgi:hypothetical protein